MSCVAKESFVPVVNSRVDRAARGYRGELGSRGL